MTHRTIAAAAFLLFGMTSLSSAADPFEKRTWSLEFTGSYTDDIMNGPQELIGGTVGVGYAVADNLITSGELSVDHVSDSGSDLMRDGTAYALTLRTKYRFAELCDVSLFVDGAIGVMLADVDVPDGQTRFNFRSSVGLGATVPLRDELQLITGARLLHISNANLGEDNEGYTGVQFYVGILIPL